MPLPASLTETALAEWLRDMVYPFLSDGFNDAARAVRELVSTIADGAARQAYRCGYSACGSGVDVTTHIDADVHFIIERVLGGAS